jgi:hypothetical protein
MFAYEPKEGAREDGKVADYEGDPILDQRREEKKWSAR